MHRIGILVFISKPKKVPISKNVNNTWGGLVSGSFLKVVYLKKTNAIRKKVRRAWGWDFNFYLEQKKAPVSKMN